MRGSKLAFCLVTGSREGNGDWPPALSDAEVNKLPRFEVKDTGWRL